MPSAFRQILQNKEFTIMVYKNGKINRDSKISDIIMNNHFMILVLERFGIELGLHDKTIEFICIENNISTEVFLSIANLHINISYIPELLFECSDIEAIIQYLKNSHDYYSKEVFPEIVQDIHLMIEYNKKPEMLMVEEFFNNFYPFLSHPIFVG